ncbi:MAG: hypothetical protein A3I39_01740 [Candidatus Yanofskybacteria bacterium RIFCSPLOWO2_02_FULL_47_9b]|uniref:Uncharacterized protein n=1 Tax=Candidatus Yanofskybacteria bacterium RIFCSPLOWO2_02_FULL_47_9b TaxID=1802708 RepID=A0A1F8H903_9BACT|nr:MAG: hypothetical protein A3I39_01740 [Candidatus Yanofskybacteria bacterium RIFCSPLOWO2_02_FULL_47_9b]
MGLEKHFCPCAPEKPHKGGHWDCCSCIPCGNCGAWIQTKFWDVHKKLANCKTGEGSAEPKKGKPLNVEEDSFDIDFRQVSVNTLGLLLEERPGSDSDSFRVSAREILDEILDHHGFFKEAVPFVEAREPGRSELRQRLLRIIFDAEMSDDEIVEKLLSFYPESARDDDLTARISSMLFEREKLFPTHAPHSS